MRSLEMILACCATIYNYHAKKKVKEPTCFYEQSLRLKDVIWKEENLTGSVSDSKSLIIMSIGFQVQ